MKIFLNKVYLLITIIFFSCSDIIETHYSSYADIIKDGGFKRGWVPKFLPESSYDIFLKSDIDINKVWLTFRFRFEHLNNIQVKLDLPDSIETISIKEILENNFDLNTSGIEYYKYSKTNYVALDSINTICYYYSTGR